MDAFGPAHRPYRFASDRKWRTQRSAAWGASEGNDICEGLHQPFAARLSNLRTGRIWIRAEIVPDLVEWDYGKYEGLGRPRFLKRARTGKSSGTVAGGRIASQVGERADRVIARVRAVAGPCSCFLADTFFVFWPPLAGARSGRGQVFCAEYG